MRLMYLFFAIIMLTGVSSTIYGQKPEKHHPRKQVSPMARLERIVTLDEAQKVEIEAIQNRYKTAFETLKSSDTENKREQFDALREDLKAEIKSILTAEQNAQLAAHQKEMEAQKAAFKASRTELREKLKAYHEENILPVLLEQRAILETQLSEEDITELVKIRSVLGDMKEKRMEATGRKKRGRANRPELSEVQLEAFNALKDLNEKYSGEIESRFEAIVDEREMWKLEMKAIREVYAVFPAQSNEDRFGAKGKRHHKHGPRREKPNFPGRQFLLLDPNVDNQALPDEVKGLQLSIYPNPASDETTLAYELMQSGSVSIVVMSENGLVQTTQKLDQAAGAQSYPLDISQYKDGVYYISVLTESGVVSTSQLVVSRQ